MNTSNLLFLLIIIFVVFDFLIERFLDYLNSTKWNNKIPEAVSRFYNAEKYQKTQDYQRTLHRFSMLTSSYSFLLMMAMLLFGGFWYVDTIARNYSENIVIVALIFFGIIGFASDFLSLPFQIYSQFVIEKKFDFNKTTAKTFVGDKIKSWILGIILGGGILSLLVWLYEKLGDNFWIYAWLVVSVFMLVITMFYSWLIVPLFNKQKPIEDGTLKEKINQFAQKTGFKINNIFVIDGSKRSTKANAYFTGLGSKKRIVLYDTLIQNHTEEEIVAVLAHEIGHYKKKHTFYGLVFSLLQTGALFYIVSLFIGNPELSMALGVNQPSFHIGIIAFAMLYGPLSLIIGLIMNAFSRNNEYEADKFAVENCDAESLKNALIKLSMNNLSNLTPHPWYVFFHYSHPPLLKRIEALEKL